jgi:selenocysteine lyase/cysteine desulfurase
MAHAKGVAVMVDGAHAVAHLNLSIEALGCDYYGASLHKWLSAPLGTGMLYVKKERIPDVWPLFAEANLDSDNIARLNHTGTIPVHSDLAILDAIAYYEKIGARKKEDRLRFLQKYWTEQVRNLPNILLNTPAESHRACAIANVGVKGISPAELAQTLLEKYGIYTVAIDGAGVMGCRITPNVFTTTEELDKLVKALTELSKF